MTLGGVGVLVPNVFVELATVPERVRIVGGTRRGVGVLVFLV